MSKNNAQSELYCLEDEYIKLKRRLYTQFFTILIQILSIIVSIEVVRAIQYEKPSLLFIHFFMIGFLIFFNRRITNLKKNQETIITCVLLVFYLLILCGHYFGNTGYFTNPLDAFYFGSTFTMFERLIATRIPSFKHRSAFSACAAMIRTLIVPANDIGSLSITYLFLIMGVYLDNDYEKKDKELFKSYFNNRDQLMKFKNLVNDEIPEAITIINTSLTKCLFMNNAFKQLVKQQSDVIDIQAQLRDFRLQKDPQSPQKQDGQTMNSSSRQDQTLLGFLQANHQVEETSPPDQKSAFHITYSPPLRPTRNRSSSPHGSDYIFEAKVLHIVWDEQPAVALILHDVTEQQTILSLKMADAYKDNLLATISHELRTPLNGILGMLQIMQKYVTETDILHYIHICKNSGQLLLGLVNSILDLNQIRAKKLKLYPERVEINSFLKDISSLFEFQCTQKDIYLKIEVSPAMPRWFTTDKNRLSQIFINLMGNALKFTSKGGITISANPIDQGDYIEFSVADTGIGIKAEDKDKLFKMFGKLEDRDTTLNRQGVGLGLTISDNLAKVLCQGNERGGIKVETEYNKGSRFHFIIRRTYQTMTAERIPSPEVINADDYLSENPHHSGYIESHLKKYSFEVRTLSSRQLKPRTLHTAPKYGTEETIGTPLLQNSTKASIFRTKVRRTLFLKEVPFSILIVDDNPLNIAVAEHFVSCQGYHVKTALYGQVAIDMLLENKSLERPIKLILMDCQMPIMDGYETTRILRKLMEEGRIEKIPIIALTANDGEGDRETCIAAGMSDHLNKPLKESELLRILRKYLKEEEAQKSSLRL